MISTGCHTQYNSVGGTARRSSSRKSRLVHGPARPDASGLSHGLRNRNFDAKKHSKWGLKLRLSKEVVTEIWFSQKWKSFDLAAYIERRKKLFEPREVIESIVDSQACKTVKFQTLWNSDVKIEADFCKNPKVQLRSKSRNRSKNRTITTYTRSSNLDSLLKSNQRILKQAYELRSKEKIKHSEVSRPSSVTSLFTAWSAENFASQVKSRHGNKVNYSSKQVLKLKAGDKHQRASKKLASICTNLFKESSHQKPSDIPEQNISVISEIQSDSDSNMNMSIDQLSESSQTYHTYDDAVRVKEVVRAEKIALKKQHDYSRLARQHKRSSSRHKVSQQLQPREFECYNDSDVIDFGRITNEKLPDNLVRGDNDEDTDSEDLVSCTKIWEDILNKAIVSLMHTKNSH